MRTVSLPTLSDVIEGAPMPWSEVGGEAAIRYTIRVCELTNKLADMIEAMFEAEGDAQYYGESAEHADQFATNIAEAKELFTRLQHEAVAVRARMGH